MKNKGSNGTKCKCKSAAAKAKKTIQKDSARIDQLVKSDKALRAKEHFQDKVADVMHEFKEGELRSGSTKGPKVKNKKQAIAIALSEAKKYKKKKK